jgi:Uma2 family endonuclease
MVAVEPRRKMSAEQFWQQYAGKPYELVRGEVKERMPAGLHHGLVAMAIGHQIAEFARRTRLGVALAAETGFRIVHPEGESVRAPDVAFIRRERLPKPLPPTFCEVIPDLVVEVISPSDTYSAMREKVDEWLNAGVSVVWVVDPQRRIVEVYQTGKPLQVLQEGDTLTAEQVLPGFQLPVQDIFAEIDSGN